MVFEKFFRKINMMEGFFEIDFEDRKLQPENRFFSDVHLYDDLKLLLSRMLISKEPVHCVLIGPPASGKTMFLISIQKSMKDVFFIDATNASGAGIVDKLFAYPRTRIILIDEIEKMPKRDQNMLLNLLETGILISTKVRKTQEMKFANIKLFATSNNIEQLSKPLRSRLMEFHLPEYDFDEFREIVEKLAANRYRLSREIADKIAFVVWYEMGTKDVRDALQLMKLVSSVDNVEKTTRIIMKYKPKILNSSPTVRGDQ
jgi:replication-associated recombination protein RarA